MRILHLDIGWLPRKTHLKLTVLLYIKYIFYYNGWVKSMATSAAESCMSNEKLRSPFVLSVMIRVSEG
jgi:hypothetical protein